MSVRRPILVVLCALVGVLVFASVPALAARTEIGRFGPGGPGSGDFEEPLSIAVEQSSGDVYVYDVGEWEGGKREGRVYKFNAEGVPEEFSYLHSINSPHPTVIETGVNAFNGGGSQIAVDNSSSGPDKGDIYIATGETAVLIYNSAGEELPTLIEEGEPTGVAVDPSGNVYVALASKRVIRKYTPVANPVKQTNYACSLWGILGLENIAVGSAGDIYTGRREYGVTKYELSSQCKAKEEEKPQASGEEIWGQLENVRRTLAVDPVSGGVSGGVYINENGSTAIKEITSEGGLVESFGSLSGRSYGVAVSDASGHEGDVYAPENVKESEVVIFGFPPVVTEYALNVVKAGTGAGAVTSAPLGIDCGLVCEASFPEEAVTLTAAAEPGSEFKGFSAGGGSTRSCSTSPCVFTIKEASEVTATFELAPVAEYALKVVKAGTGAGTVTSVPSGIDCLPTETACTANFPEEMVTLTATEDSGSGFRGFSAGGGSARGCSVSPCVFTIKEASEVTATFEPEAGGKEGKEGPPGKEGKEGKEGSAGKEGKEGPAGREGKEGQSVTVVAFGPGEHECADGGIEVVSSHGIAYVCDGMNGTNGTNGSDGTNGTNGNGERGLLGPIGPVGPTGAQGPAGPAGQVELVTCKTVKKDGKKVQQCTTRLVLGTVKFTASGMAASAMLSRHGVVYAAGIARVAHGHTSLRLAPVRKLRPGRYTLTLTSGSGRHERIRSEAFTLAPDRAARSGGGR